MIFRKHMKKRIFLLFPLVALCGIVMLNSCKERFSTMKVDYLRCEYLVNPFGIDVCSPRLSWVLGSDTRNQVQTGYQVLAASSTDGLSNDVGDL
jgi:hypothetical protein